MISGYIPLHPRNPINPFFLVLFFVIVKTQGKTEKKEQSVNEDELVAKFQ